MGETTRKVILEITTEEEFERIVASYGFREPSNIGIPARIVRPLVYEMYYDSLLSDFAADSDAYELGFYNPLTRKWEKYKPQELSIPINKTRVVSSVRNNPVKKGHIKTNFKAQGSEAQAVMRFMEQGTSIVSHSVNIPPDLHHAFTIIGRYDSKKYIAGILDPAIKF